jgi:hypothetical protein
LSSIDKIIISGVVFGTIAGTGVGINKYNNCIHTNNNSSHEPIINLNETTAYINETNPSSDYCQNEAVAHGIMWGIGIGFLTFMGLYSFYNFLPLCTTNEISNAELL